MTAPSGWPDARTLRPIDHAPSAAAPGTSPCRPVAPAPPKAVFPMQPVWPGLDIGPRADSARHVSRAATPGNGPSSTPPPSAGRLPAIPGHRPPGNPVASDRRTTVLPVAAKRRAATGPCPPGIEGAQPVPQRVGTGRSRGGQRNGRWENAAPLPPPSSPAVKITGAARHMPAPGHGRKAPRPRDADEASGKPQDGAMSPRTRSARNKPSTPSARGGLTGAVYRRAGRARAPRLHRPTSRGRRPRSPGWRCRCPRQRRPHGRPIGPPRGIARAARTGWCANMPADDLAGRDVHAAPPQACRQCGGHPRAAAHPQPVGGRGAAARPCAEHGVDARPPARRRDRGVRSLHRRSAPPHIASHPRPTDPTLRRSARARGPNRKAMRSNTNGLPASEVSDPAEDCSKVAKWSLDLTCPPPADPHLAPIAPHCPGREGDPSRIDPDPHPVAKAVLRIARPGCPWQALRPAVRQAEPGMQTVLQIGNGQNVPFSSKALATAPGPMPVTPSATATDRAPEGDPSPRPRTVSWRDDTRNHDPGRLARQSSQNPPSARAGPQPAQPGGAGQGTVPGPPPL